MCDTIDVHYTRCIAVWKILKRATSFLRDYPRAMEIPGTRQGWHDFETGRTGFRRPHYKWPIRRRFPNELLKRTPRLLRIFKLGRYFQLACIWYRQPNRTPRFHPPVPHPPSFFSSLFFFNRLPPHTLFLGEKKNLESTLLPPLIALHSLHSISSSSFFFYFFSPSSLPSKRSLSTRRSLCFNYTSSSDTLSRRRPQWENSICTCNV